MPADLVGVTGRRDNVRRRFPWPHIYYFIVSRSFFVLVSTTWSRRRCSLLCFFIIIIIFFFFCSLSYSYPVRSSNTSLSRLEGRERLGPYEAFLNGKESDAVERSTPATGVAVAPRLNTLLPRKFQSYKADITVPQLHAYTIENAEKNETSQRQEHREGR